MECHSAEAFFAVFLGNLTYPSGEDGQFYYCTSTAGGRTSVDKYSTLMGQVRWRVDKDLIDPGIMARMIVEKCQPWQCCWAHQGQDYKGPGCERTDVESYDYSTLRTPAADEQAEMIIRHRYDLLMRPEFPVFHVVTCTNAEEFQLITSGEFSVYEGHDSQWMYVSSSSDDRELDPGEAPHPYESIYRLPMALASEKALEDATFYGNSPVLTPPYPVPPAYLEWSARTPREGRLDRPSLPPPGITPAYQTRPIPPGLAWLHSPEPQPPPPRRHSSPSHETRPQTGDTSAHEVP